MDDRTCFNATHLAGGGVLILTIVLCGCTNYVKPDRTVLTFPVVEVKLTLSKGNPPGGEVSQDEIKTRGGVSQSSRTVRVTSNQKIDLVVEAWDPNGIQNLTTTGLPQPQTYVGVLNNNGEVLGHVKNGSQTLTVDQAKTVTITATNFNRKTTTLTFHLVPVAPPVCCGGTCSDMNSDPANCGACGKVCGGSQVCWGGQCATRDLKADVSNCGTYGDACGADLACEDGSCLCPTARRLCGHRFFLPVSSMPPGATQLEVCGNYGKHTWSDPCEAMTLDKVNNVYSVYVSASWNTQFQYKFHVPGTDTWIFDPDNLATAPDGQGNTNNTLNVICAESPCDSPHKFLLLATDIVGGPTGVTKVEVCGDYSVPPWFPCDSMQLDNGTYIASVRSVGFDKPVQYKFKIWRDNSNDMMIDPQNPAIATDKDGNQNSLLAHSCSVTCPMP